MRDGIFVLLALHFWNFATNFEQFAFRQLKLLKLFFYDDLQKRFFQLYAPTHVAFCHIFVHCHFFLGSFLPVVAFVSVTLSPPLPVEKDRSCVDSFLLTQRLRQLTSRRRLHNSCPPLGGSAAFSVEHCLKVWVFGVCLGERGRLWPISTSDTTTREPKRAFEVPVQCHHQNSTKGPTREGEKNENCGGGGPAEGGRCPAKGCPAEGGPAEGCSASAIDFGQFRLQPVFFFSSSANFDFG